MKSTQKFDYKDIWINETNKTVIHLAYTFAKNSGILRPLILDSGCNGARAETSALMVKSNLDFVGIDINLTWLREKQNRFRSLPLKLLCADSHFLPFKENMFDSIIMVEVFEHLANPDLAMKDAYRSLKEDGLVIISTPNPYGLWSLVTDRISPLIFRSLDKVLEFCKIKSTPYKYTGHVTFLSFKRIIKIFTLNHFNIAGIYSVEALGIIKVIHAFLIKINFRILGEKNVKGLSRANDFLNFIEIKLASLLPLRFHSGWIFVFKK